jgi:hypothetical protein
MPLRRFSSFSRVSFGAGGRSATMMTPIQLRKNP